MNKRANDFQYSPIIEYDFSQWFQDVQYNGNNLTKQEKLEFVSMIDETIDQFSGGLPMLYETLETNKGLNDEFHKIERAINSIYLFTLITMIDSMVASKYFLLADKDYDRRFMRGKLMVILNEGFKRLFGFGINSKEKPEWSKLEQHMEHFPERIREQYLELTDLLEKHSKSSTWFRDVRNYETHIEADKLYLSRSENIIESKVIIESATLFTVLLAVNHFLSNAHACLLNFLIKKYIRGELKDE